jgi:hypothetical protein
MAQASSVESTGIQQLDQILGGLFMGDNVIWYDDAGSLAAVFCLNLISAAQARNEPVIYISFDRSPKNLLDKLGTLSTFSTLTVLDGFTNGKGASADVARNMSQLPLQPSMHRLQIPDCGATLRERLAVWTASLALGR